MIFTNLFVIYIQANLSFLISTNLFVKIKNFIFSFTEKSQLHHSYKYSSYTCSAVRYEAKECENFKFFHFLLTNEFQFLSAADTETPNLFPYVTIYNQICKKEKVSIINVN